MEEFTFTDLNLDRDKVLSKAMKEPIVLIKNGTPEFVMMPYKTYRKACNTQKVYRLGEEPPEVSDLLDEGLDQLEHLLDEGLDQLEQ